MNILINASNIREGGGIQVIHSFLTEISSNREHNFIIVVSEQVWNQINSISLSSNFKIFVYSIKPTLFKAFLGRDKFLDRIVLEFKPRCIFSIFGPHYWNPKVFHIVGFAKPQYIYKDSPFFSNLSFVSRIKNFTYELIHMYSFRNFCNVLVSETIDVSEKLSLIFPKKKIFTVSNYYNQVFDDSSRWIYKEIPKFDGFTFLTISSNYPHKNLGIIPKVIQCLDDYFPEYKVRFILSLDMNAFPSISESIRKKILFLGKVSIEECPSLYLQSDFLFLPTLLECFSASYVEAMKMEKPILTSNLSFSRNICQDSAVYFDPLDPINISKIIVSLIIDKKKQTELVLSGKKRLSYFDTASIRSQKYLKLIEESVL